MDTNFDCPHCGQNLDAPEDMAGSQVPCPACSKLILIPEPAYAGAPAAGPASKPPAARKRDTGPIPAKAEEKGSTSRIDVPRGVRLPARTTRVVFIKRTAG